MWCEQEWRGVKTLHLAHWLAPPCPKVAAANKNDYTILRQFICWMSNLRHVQSLCFQANDFIHSRPLHAVLFHSLRTSIYSTSQSWAATVSLRCGMALLQVLPRHLSWPPQECRWRSHIDFVAWKREGCSSSCASCFPRVWTEGERGIVYRELEGKRRHVSFFANVGMDIMPYGSGCRCRYDIKCWWCLASSNVAKQKLWCKRSKKQALSCYSKIKTGKTAGIRKKRKHLPKHALQYWKTVKWQWWE